MDSKEYIASGAIEACVMGLASAEEMAELEQLRAQYPEINDAILSFELQLESSLQENGMSVPVSVKQELKNKLRSEFRREELQTSSKTTSIVRPIWQWVAAASIILLITSAGFNYYLFNKNEQAERSNTELLAEMKNLRTDNQLVNAKLEEMHKGMTMMSDPAIAKVTMPGMGNHERNKAMILWDTKTKDVYLMPMDLPQAPKGMQYQLWAMVDGKPVDAGMMGDCSIVCNMKNIPKAEAFAITLEKQGGSPAPDMAQLFVMGKVSP